MPIGARSTGAPLFFLPTQAFGVSSKQRLSAREGLTRGVPQPTTLTKRRCGGTHVKETLSPFSRAACLGVELP